MTEAGHGAGTVRPKEAVLRRLRWWDIEAVHRIEEDLFPDDPWSVEMFWSELADVPQSRHYLVAETADGIVGYAGLMTQPGTTVGHTESWVQNIAVAREHQGEGLGAVLLTALLTEAGRRHSTEVWLEVRTDNEPAQRLYTRFGFESVGIRRGYYQPGNHDALIMRRTLP